ncbi:MULTISPECIES: hypothetical protein [unclassified Halomonas]|uniref:hypothetical protein n=1 Tax=unclassified Halomonas TaxID=2609666 RepID=UPI0040335A8F
MERCTNKDCNKDFYVTSMGGGVPGGKELEPVICPYCGTVVRTEMTSATFSTRKIEDVGK